jgi:hypothetical protein
MTEVALGAAASRVAAAGGSQRRLSAAVLWLVAAANGGVVVWLWVHGGGISAVHSASDAWTSAGRLTGLLAVYPALVQVLLLARLPVLERLVGFDRLTVWHRVNGKVCLAFVLAHVIAITIGYTGLDGVRLSVEISRLLTLYPGMVAATVGTGIMLAVVGASDSPTLHPEPASSPKARSAASRRRRAGGATSS